MADDERVKIIKGWLGITIDVSHDPSEDSWFVGGIGPYIGIEVLQFDFLPSHVVGKAAEFRAFILLALLIAKGMTFDTLPDRVRILF